jgi:phosphoglycolate phosphatase
MPLPAPLLVFDLDGTLVDTAPDLAQTLNVILTRNGFEPVHYDQARLMVGAGAREMLARALQSQNVDVAPVELDRMFGEFIEHYAENIADGSRPFPGLLAALDRLAADGFVFAVCTNKLESLSLRLLDALDLTRRFTFVCGQDTYRVRKPDPAVLRFTIERAGGTMADAIMIGDSATDIDTAHAAGVPVIAVDFGYTDVPVAKLNPTRVISRFDQLPAMVAELRQDKPAVLTGG